jgi:hypothetical protein
MACVDTNDQNNSLLSHPENGNAPTLVLSFGAYMN